ncbi:MAG: hypothetical protein ACYC92_15650 [Candidatus Acidiferrales bacterium]
MQRKSLKLRPNDLVEVKSPDEIASTLDAAGTVDQLPFMREMVEYCGRRFRVSRRVVKVCASGMKSGSVLREFRADDVVLLEGLRCSGADHDGCQKGCVIFWREAWLRKVDDHSSESTIRPTDSKLLLSRLKSLAAPNIYFCQASEILRATKGLTKRERYSKWIDDIRAGNCSPLEMARRLGIFFFWKARRTLLGPYGRGKSKDTPAETLNLQPGELVQVKPIESICKTLDDKATNRGLWFSPNMRLLCGQQRRVERRIDKLIVDGSGEMRQMRNTVLLEGSHCGCAHIAFGGCSRAEYVYWREIWLHRADKFSANT